MNEASPITAVSVRVARGLRLDLREARVTVPPQTTLEEFLEWWMQTRPFKPPMECPINVDGSLYGVVLYRDGPFQVQLFIVAPGAEIPDHVHPNVDSYEVYFSGHV